MCFSSFKMLLPHCKIPCGCPGKGPFSGPGPMTFPYNYRTCSGLSHNLLTFLKVVCRLQHRVNDSKNPWNWIGWFVMLLNMTMPDRFPKATQHCDQAEDYGMLVFVKLLVWQHLAEACGCLSWIRFSQVSRNEWCEFRQFGLGCQGYRGQVQQKLHLKKFNLLTSDESCPPPPPKKQPGTWRWMFPSSESPFCLEPIFSFQLLEPEPLSSSAHHPVQSV